MSKHYNENLFSPGENMLSRKRKRSLFFIHFFFLALIFAGYPGQSAENTHLLLGQANKKISQKEWPQAEKILQKITVLEKNHALAWQKMAYTQMMQGKYSQAGQSYEQAFKLDPVLANILGVQWSKLAIGQYQKSIAWGQKAIHIAPNNYYATMRLADAYFLLKKYKTSLKFYKKVSKNFPKNIPSRVGAYLSSRNMGEPEQARQFLDQAQDINPDHPALQPYVKRTDLSWFAQFYYQYFSYSNNPAKSDGSSFGGAFSLGINKSIYFGLGYEQTQLTGLEDIDQYKIHKIHPYFSYNKNEHRFLFHGHLIQSNDPYSDKSVACYGLYKQYSGTWNWHLGGGYLHFPDYDGFQGEMLIAYRLFSNLFLNAQIMAQSIFYAQTTTTQPRPNRPPQTQTQTEFDSFTSFTAGFSWYSRYFGFGGQYRWGSLYTPLLNQGHTLVENTETLKSGYMVFVNINLPQQLYLVGSYNAVPQSANHSPSSAAP